MNAKKRIVPEYNEQAPSLFPTDFGMFRFFVGGPWEDSQHMWSWDRARYDRLLSVDTVAELEALFDEMIGLAKSHESRREKNNEIHEAEIVEATEAVVYIAQLLKVLDPNRKPKNASKHPVYKLLKTNPKALVCLAFTLGQLSVIAKYREAEKQYRRGRTRYDNLKAANASKDKPPSKDEFLKLYEQAQSLFKDDKGARIEWLAGQLNRCREQIYRYIKQFKKD